MVKIIAITEKAIETAAYAAQTCYGNKKGDINSDQFQKFITSGDAAKLIENCILKGHLSVIEHVNITLRFDDISRTCSHQEVRHRLQAISQKSQRYCDESDFDVIVPPDIKNDDELYKMFLDGVDYAKRLYNAFVARGIKREDARYILPEGTTTSMVVTMNMRELRHIIELRCETHAQWEIRNLFKEVARTIIKERPELKVFLVGLEV